MGALNKNACSDLGTTCATLHHKFWKAASLLLQLPYRWCSNFKWRNGSSFWAASRRGMSKEEKDCYPKADIALKLASW